MKHFLLLLFVCTNGMSIAQEALSSMPKEKRDSLLVEITQNLLKEKFPKWYRKEIIPSVVQGDFMFLKQKWLQEGWPKSYYILPDYLKPEDLCYHVKLYYEKWRDKHFPYTAEATIIDKTHEVYRIYLPQPNAGYRWHVLQKMKGEELLSSMPKQKRDSILVEISQNVLKEKYPELYHKDIEPNVEQSDFRLKGLEWTDDIVKYTPDYVYPEDLFYKVILYYEKWREDKLKYPFTAVIYIVEKTREPYLIRLGSENNRYYHDLLNPNRKE